MARSSVCLAGAAPAGKVASRRRAWSRLWMVLVLALYGTVLCLLVPRHEPWFDEAQPWLVARDAGLHETFARMTHYDGTPGLWHLLLKVLHWLHLPYMSMNILSALISFAGVVLLVVHSPLPRVVRAVLPFAYFFCYQYAVVARSYCLVGPLLFLAAMLHRDRMSKPLRYVLVLSVLANANLHGALIAGALVLLHLLGVPRRWRRLEPAGRRRHVLAGLLFAAVTAGVILQVYWIPHVSFAPGFCTDGAEILKRAGTILCKTMAENIALSTAVLLISLEWFVRRKVLWIYLLPTLGLLALGAIKHNSPWHQGVVFYVWVFALWVSFQGCPDGEPATGGAPAGGGRLDCRQVARKLLRGRMVSAALVVLALHVYWTVRAGIADYRGAYSGSLAAARWLRQTGVTGRTIACSNWPGLSIQPYFQRNLFFNCHRGAARAYWLWDRDYMREFREQADQAQRECRADILIYSLKFPVEWDEWAAMNERPEQEWPYRLAGRFDGSMFWKDGVHESDSYAVFVRRDLEAPSTGP